MGTILRDKVNSIADLKALINIPVGKVIETDSYYGDNNGGGNVFVKVTAVSQVDNGGTIIIGIDLSVYESTTPNIKNALQFGAKGDGSTDNVTIINSMLSEVQDYDTVVFDNGYIFNISTQILLSNVSFITIKGGGTIHETLDNVEGFLLTNVDSSLVKDLIFTGIETLSNWNSETPAYRQVFKFGFQLEGCTDTHIKNIKVSNKRSAIQIEQSLKCKASDIRLYSLGGSISDGNYQPVVRVNGGTRYNIDRIVGDGSGSLVLVTGAANRVIINDCICELSYDNGIYISDGHDCTVKGCMISNTGAGIRARGSNNIIISNNIIDCNTGIYASGTGLVTDEFGANGGNTVISNNSIDSCDGGYGINLSNVNSLYMRDVIISNNNISNHLTTGNFSPIYVVAEKGITITDNIIYKFASDAGIYLIGPAVDNRIFECKIIGNSVYSDNASRAIKLEKVEKSIISNNALETTASFQIEGRETYECIFSENKSDTGEIYVHTLYNSTNNIFRDNDMILASGISTTSIMEGNKTTLDVADTVTPVRVGQIRLNSNEFYIATETNDSDDWGKITYDGTSEALTGTAIDLSNNVGHAYNMASALADVVYTTTNEVVNGNAICLINTASEPTVTGYRTKLPGATWTISTDMYMVVQTLDGTNVDFYFLDIT